MNVDIDSTDDSGAGEQALFFRAADRLRLEGYVTALTQNGMSLSLVSGHDAILDHYGKLLISRLRKVSPHFDIEVYFPASSEALIERFNHVLQAYSIADAMASNAPIAPPRVWIVHDASSLPDHEIQLLARLVQNFPAANIRLVMLLTHSSQKQQLLNPFGRRILNWDIEAPNPDQRSIMLIQATAQGREAIVNALLMQLGNHAPPITHETHATTVNSKLQQMLHVLQRFSKIWVASKKIKWLVSGCLLLAFCILAVSHGYYKTSLPDFIFLNFGNLTAGRNLSATPIVNPTRLVNGGSGNEKNPTPSVTTHAAQNAAQEVEEIQHTPEQTRAGQSWLLKMTTGTYVVVHSSESSFQEAKYWLLGHAQLKFAQIVAHKLPHQPNLQFSVVSGPFTSTEEAHRFTQNPSNPKGAQVRSVQSMKEQFPSKHQTITPIGRKEER